MRLSMLRSPLTQLHCASPTTELTSKDETTMVQRAGAFVHMHAHHTHLFFHPSAELERKMISYPKLFSEKAIKKAKEQIFCDEISYDFPVWKRDSLVGRSTKLERTEEITWDWLFTVSWNKKIKGGGQLMQQVSSRFKGTKGHIYPFNL